MLAIGDEVRSMTEEIYKKVSNRIEGEWYPYHEGEWFTHTDLCVYFQWDDTAIRKAVSQKLWNDYQRISEPKLEKKNKTYRLIDRTLEQIDWENADPNDIYHIKMPYDIITGKGFPFEDYISLPPRA